MYSTILVPLDGSRLAERALVQARGLARSLAATVHLAQVVSIPRELRGILEEAAHADPGLARQVVDARMAGAQAYLREVAAGLEADGIPVTTAVLEGVAEDEILDYARTHRVDCIIVTTQGLSGLRRYFLGSVTDRIIRSSEVPVLVVPTGAE